MIEHRRHGTSGPWVVVLHGGPGAPGSAGGLAQALGTGFRVLEPFERRAAGPPLTVDGHVEDLRALLDGVGAGPDVAWVGWSAGAVLALAAAAALPDRTASVALVGSATFDPRARAVYRARMDAALGPAGLERKARAHAAIAATPPGPERDALVAAWGAVADAATAVDPLPDDGPPAPPVDARGHAETWADMLARQASGRDPASFAAVRAPVLLLQGADDPHPGPEIAASLAPHLRRFRAVTLPRCGHVPWRERHARAAFLAILEGFLRAP